MSRYIDADALIEKKWQAENESCFYALNDVVSVDDINEAPSIDIVRCKECRHWVEERLLCVMWNSETNATHPNAYAEDFCSYGERRK